MYNSAFAEDLTWSLLPSSAGSFFMCFQKLLLVRCLFIVKVNRLSRGLRSQQLQKEKYTELKQNKQTRKKPNKQTTTVCMSKCILRGGGSQRVIGMLFSSEFYLNLKAPTPSPRLLIGVYCQKLLLITVKSWKDTGISFPFYSIYSL